jgi:hypothetical protein
MGFPFDIQCEAVKRPGENTRQSEKLRQDEQDFSGLRGKEEDKFYLSILINLVNPV